MRHTDLAIDACTSAFENNVSLSVRRRDLASAAGAGALASLPSSEVAEVVCCPLAGKRARLADLA